ncbi:putative serine/threonine-protein kinase isoform X2 [Typha angustifolia]|uniref:putative serine/threonine-protein kinase isoform X2 n=1 Tax=Typha angustifolia TaxID=59011 RepID=UPI003C2C1C26
MSWCCFRPIKRRNDLQHQESLVFSSDKNIKLFSYGELKSATDNFHQGNKIGRGGFGTVYKGILRSGQEVAVKVLSAESRQGVKEFLTEIDVITNVKHPNLVELVGCCVEADNRILVYEYLENNSLDHALLGPNSDPRKLDWNTRSAICLGVAKGLAYLHEELQPHIVHRDIKASNILIDRNCVPKIGDFGLAKLFPDNITHISTRVAGTTGYLAPEYALHGQLTRKADIYSFGVLILEIVSGRSSSKMLWTEMDKLLLEWIWQLYEEGRLKEAVDPVLKEYPEEQVIQYIKVALFCTQAAAGRRPSIQQVVEMMSKTIKLNEKELTPPGYVDDSTFKASRATNSSNSRFQDSYSRGTTAPFTSNAITFSDMIPR